MKLYRFRPLNAFLFKELMYQELYFSTSQELNDPLDLTTNVNFYSLDEPELKALTTFIIREGFIANHHIENVKKYFDIFNDDQLFNFIKNEFQVKEAHVVLLDELKAMLLNFFSKTDLPHISVDELIERINLKLSQIINNSAVACFTTRNDNFLMWSHYASSHKGICLEFDVSRQDDNSSKLPMKYFHINTGKTFAYEIDVHRVIYESPTPMLNFYEFYNAFTDSDDIDLKFISKYRYHYFAENISKLFCKKLHSWSTEEEWRIVEVNFRNTLPEERISHFDINAISSVYFGANTAHYTIQRIINIFRKENHEPNYFQAKLDGTGVVKFIPFDIQSID